MANSSIQVFESATSSSSSSGQSILSQVTETLNSYETKAAHQADVSVFRNDIDANADAIAQLRKDHDKDMGVVEAAQNVMSQDIADLQSLHDGSVTPNLYYVAEHAAVNTTTAAYTNFKGNPDVAADFDAYLLDCTDNEGKFTTPIRKLRKNNYLRDANGAYAPVVYASAEHLNALSGAYNASGTAVNYSAASLWEIDKPLIKANPLVEHPTKLYTTSDHTVQIAHYPRPWESTHLEYSIGNANNKTLYFLDGQVSPQHTTKQYTGLFRAPITWDGITEHSYYKLEPTALFPCPYTVISGKARCLFYADQPTGLDGNSKSSNSNSLGLVNSTSRTYPQTSDVNQEKNMRHARANNKDASLPYPFAEGGLLATDVHIAAVELLAGTRAIHDADLYGTGISSDDTPSAANFFKVGGVRTTNANNDNLSENPEDASVTKWNGCTWTYFNWSSNTPDNLISSATNWSNATTGYKPKEECMESQMAYSYAKEVGIPPTTDYSNPILFTFYGNLYYYVEVTGANIPTTSMNARVYKVVIRKNVGGGSAPKDVMYVLRFSLFNGMNLSGDIWQYQGGGYEQVCTINSTSSTTGHTWKFYVQPDQTKWVWNTSVEIDGNNTYPFEDLYKVIDSYNGTAITNISDGWTLVRLPYTGFKVASGGTLTTGACHYHYSNVNWTKVLNHKCRAFVFRRGRAGGASCSPRCLRSDHLASYTDSHLGGSAQALVAIN